MSRTKTYPLTAALRENPDVMIRTDKYIAIYDSELDQCVMIPGFFEGVTDEMANQTMQANLTAVKGN